MSDSGYFEPPPPDPDAPDAWAGYAKRYGWLRTALVPLSLMVLLLPGFVIPTAAGRALYLLPAFLLWWAFLDRALDWLLPSTKDRDGPKSNDAGPVD